MIGLDTNILARYYVDTQDDEQAARQREIARKLIDSGHPLMICKTVILELQWLLLSYFKISKPETLAVIRHLLAIPHAVVEDRISVERALSNSEKGLDVADALHHACYRNCDSMATFDDLKFARRVTRLALLPPIVIPA